MTEGQQLLLEMCRVSEPTGTDREIVERALHRYRDITRMFRYGGMAADYALSKAALEAFDRMLQPALFDVEVVT